MGASMIGMSFIKLVLVQIINKNSIYNRHPFGDVYFIARRLEFVKNIR